MMKAFSRFWQDQPIATRLFYLAAVWSSVLLLATGILLTVIYRHSVESAFDDRLSVYLRAIVADVTSPGDDTRTEPGQLGEPRFELASSGWYWQITRVDSDQEDIKASRSLFSARLPKLADQGVQPELGGLRRGYAQGPDVQKLRFLERVVDVGDEGIYLIQVTGAFDEVEGQVRDFELALILAFTFLALGLVFATALQLRFGLRPLRTLQEQVSAIRRGTAEKIEGTFPRDLAPLAGELNLLIASNRDIVERARTHVGNLAHALKTPLSVIINEAGSKSDAASLIVGEQAALMRDQVSYYLDRARAAARSSVIGTICDVTPVVTSLLRTFEKIYADRQIAFALSGQSDLRFRGEAQDLQDMVGNLLDNAGKWAHYKVAVQIQLQQSEDERNLPPMLVIILDDDGPGLPLALRQEAMARGRRLDETKPGSGLGLSIVVDLAASYSGSLQLEESPSGGLRAILHLPAGELGPS